MTFNFNFRSLEERRDLHQLVDFMMHQDLGYPGYEDWIQRAEKELEQGSKKVVLAFSDRRLVGDVVYQPHKQFPRIREVKNIRVHPEVRRRDFAHFMLRQAEQESQDTYDAIVCDARSDQRDVIQLLKSMGYIPIIEVPLYEKNASDVILMKSFTGRTEAGLVYQVRTGILATAK